LPDQLIEIIRNNIIMKWGDNKWILLILDLFL
jgi:hypothetical protein